jgi:hypothetical protein
MALCHVYDTFRNQASEAFLSVLKAYKLRQNAVSNVEFLFEFEKFHRVQFQPFASFRTKIKAKPVGQIYEVLVFDGPACDFAFEAVIASRHVCAGIMRPTG